MAVVNSLSTSFLITTKSSFTTRTIRLPVQRLLVSASIHDNIPNISSSSSSSSSTTITTSPRQIRSTLKNELKVFEDKSTGVVCYIDENGEITCEGYDEGPRFSHQLPNTSPSKSRDEEIVELLQRNWHHMADVAVE